MAMHPHAPPRRVASDTRRTVFQCVCRFGDLAQSTVRYRAQWVQQGHAHLNTLRASRPHQENTLSYSRRQKMGLAVVEQYSIKQTSVLFPSHVHQGLENIQFQFHPAPRQPGFSKILQLRKAAAFLGFNFLSASLVFFSKFLRDSDIFKGFFKNCWDQNALFKTVSDEMLSEIPSHTQRKKVSGT